MMPGGCFNWRRLLETPIIPSVNLEQVCQKIIILLLEFCVVYAVLLYGVDQDWSETILILFFFFLLHACLL